MNWITPAITVIVTAVFMEFVAWFTHKYVMHGFLWNLHKDHHQKEPGFFEKNDSFFLIFAVPSFLLTFLGSVNGMQWWFWIGVGIAVYGFIYFLIHEVYIHQRLKWLRNIDHPYFKAIRKAHYVHHRHKGKEEGECFGMLVVPWKYFKSTFSKNSKAQA